MSAPAEDAPVPPAPAEQAPEKGEKILRQITLISYEGGGFRILGSDTFNPMNDLGGVLGDLAYAKKWILEQWELSFIERRLEVTSRIAAEHRKNAPALVPGSAAAAFLRGGRGGH